MVTSVPFRENLYTVGAEEAVGASADIPSGKLVVARMTILTCKAPKQA